MKPELFNGLRECGLSREDHIDSDDILSFVDEENGRTPTVNVSVYDFHCETSVRKGPRYSTVKPDRVFLDFDNPGNIGYEIICETNELMKKMGDPWRRVTFTGGHHMGKATNFQMLVYINEPQHGMETVGTFQKDISLFLEDILYEKYGILVEDDVVDHQIIGSPSAMMRVPGTIHLSTFKYKRFCVVCNRWYNKTVEFCECGTETLVRKKWKIRDFYAKPITAEELDFNSGKDILRKSRKQTTDIYDDIYWIGEGRLDLSAWDCMKEDIDYIPLITGKLVRSMNYPDPISLPPCLQMMLRCPDLPAKYKYQLAVALKSRFWEARDIQWVMDSHYTDSEYRPYIPYLIDELFNGKYAQNNFHKNCFDLRMFCPDSREGCGRSHPIEDWR